MQHPTRQILKQLHQVITLTLLFYKPIHQVMLPTQLQYMLMVHSLQLILLTPKQQVLAHMLIHLLVLLTLRHRMPIQLSYRQILQSQIVVQQVLMQTVHL